MKTYLAGLATVLLLALSLACSSDPEPQPPEGGGGGGSQLAGRAVQVEKSGPWIVRRLEARESRRSGGWTGAGPSSPPAGGAEVSLDAAAPVPSEVPLRDDADGYDAGSAGDRMNEQGGAPLRAGSTDDNENFEEFLKFLAEWSDRKATVGGYDLLDVTDRRFVRVVDKAGRPVPAATVRIVDEQADRVLFEGRTYGDGRVAFYPRLAQRGVVVDVADEGGAAPAEPRLLVEVAAGEVRKRETWNAAGAELSVVLEGAPAVAEPIQLDVLFLVDTTGSMGDEIERIKRSLLATTEKLRGLAREFDLRYGAVLYRDLTDDYVTMAHPFTGDVEAFDQALEAMVAGGGGDTPESLNQGLAEAIGRDDWRPGAAKVVFLIADAPPHLDYQGDVSYAETVQAAAAKGIRVHSVAASGLDQVGTLVFRQISQFTRGKFIFIEYVSIAATAESHGVTGPVASNNLDQILFEQIRDEIAKWGR